MKIRRKKRNVNPEVSGTEPAINASEVPINEPSFEEMPAEKEVNEKGVPLCLMDLKDIFRPGRDRDPRRMIYRCRDEEVSTIFVQLWTTQYHNLLIIGAPGTGKDAIVRAFVEKIIKNQCPECYKGYHVYQLNISMFDGSLHDVDLVRSRVDLVYQFFSENPKSILYIQYMDDLVAAGAYDYFLEFFMKYKVLSTSLKNGCECKEEKAECGESGANKEWMDVTEFDSTFNIFYLPEFYNENFFYILQHQIKELTKKHGVRVSKEMFDISYNFTDLNCQSENLDYVLSDLEEAMIWASFRGSSVLEVQDIFKVRSRGHKVFMKYADTEKWHLAVHEAGHAVVGHFIGYDITGAQILPCSDDLGNVMCKADSITVLDKPLLMMQMKEFYAGKLATEMFGLTSCEGADGDIETATKIARRMVEEYEMAEEIVGAKDNNVLYSEHYKVARESAVEDLVGSARGGAREILAEHKYEVEIVAQALLKRYILTGKEVVELIKGDMDLDDLEASEGYFS